MKYSCLYSIVRFAPHAETEEFANVGIVLTAPAYGRMEYRLARRNWKRVNQFFECPQLFAKAIDVAQNELESARLMTAQATDNQIVNHFRYLTEPRESLIRFSPMRSIWQTISPIRSTACMSASLSARWNPVHDGKNRW